VGIFDHQNGTVSYFEQDLTDLSFSDNENFRTDAFIRQSEGMLYLIKYIYNADNKEYSWVAFNTENNRMTRYTGKDSPCNQEVNNNLLIINDKVWQSKTDWTMIKEGPSDYCFYYRLFMTTYLY